MTATSRLKLLTMEENESNDSQQRLKVLQTTDPELLMTLLEIDSAKNALRGHCPATGSSRAASNAKLVSGMSRSASTGSASISPEYDATVRAGRRPLPRPQRTISAATQAVKREELPMRAKRTNSATRTKNPGKDQTWSEATLPRALMPKSNLTPEQKQQQLFLNRRAAMYRPTPPKSSESPVSDHTPKNRLRRHCVVDIEVSEPELRLMFRETEAVLPRTWKESFCHFLKSLVAGPEQPSPIDADTINKEH